MFPSQSIHSLFQTPSRQRKKSPKRDAEFSRFSRPNCKIKLVNQIYVKLFANREKSAFFKPFLRYFHTRETAQTHFVNIIYLLATNYLHLQPIANPQNHRHLAQF